MLSDINAIATVAVKDLKAAAGFYGGTLELEEVSREGQEVITYRCGSSVLNVYRSEHAGTNHATAVTWALGEGIKEMVRALKTKGVVFEHYDMPDMRLDGDVYVGGDLQVAWFKDPDGNILNLASR